MERKRRTDVDFSKHKLSILIDTHSESWVLAIPNSNYQKIIFTNIHNQMVVFGDYSNWVFNRFFEVKENNFVDDSYWAEKAILGDSKNVYIIDWDKTKNHIKNLLYETKKTVDLYEKLEDFDENDEDYIYDIELISFYEDLLYSLEHHIDTEEEYYSYIDECELNLDVDNLTIKESINPHLQIVFDAFDEICERLPNHPYLIENKQLKYNPNFGDDKECECGHPYHRHFDHYEDMNPWGCKYCKCHEFIENENK